MMVNNLLRNLYKNYTKMDKSQQMLSSQRKFLRPSDDPIGVTRSLRLTTEIVNMQQYKRNTQDCDSWLQSSEQAVNNAISVMQRIRELTVQGSTGTYSEQDRKKIADEIAELKNELISVGNTTYAGSYLFSGFKTDKALLNADGTYDLDGGILSGGEIIEVNVGVNDRIGMNILGQRIFGSMSTTTYEEYVLKGISEFKGVSFDSSNNKLVISYNGTQYTITMPEEKYTSIDGLRFVQDLNDAIASASPATTPALNQLIKASLEDGKVVLKGPRGFNIENSTTMDVKDIMGMEKDQNAVLTKVTVSDLDDIDQGVFNGSTTYLLKASDDFAGTTAAANFTIYYGDNTYTITMDREYKSTEDKEFIYDFNKKLAEIPGLAGHVSLSVKDGQFAITADKQFKLEATSDFDQLGFDNSSVNGSGLKGAKAAYAAEGGKLDLFNDKISISAPENQLYIKYGDKIYSINLSEEEYGYGTTKTFNDLIKDIQSKINSIPELKGYVNVTEENGSIRFYADQAFELVYGMKGNFASVSPTITTTNDRFDIKLGDGSPITIKLPQGSYSIDDFTQALQSAIDSELALRGKIIVSNDGTNISFYSQLPITLSPANGSGLITSDSSSSSKLMDSIGFNTAKESVYIGDRVESGSATQLLGVIDQLVKDLNSNNSEGISKALSRIDAHIANLNAVRAEIGVKTNRLELTLNRIEDDNINLKGLLSKNEDVDMAEAIMNLQMQQNVYNAALSVGAKIISLSLVDFIN